MKRLLNYEGEQGGAVVEMGILSLLVVPIVFYAIFFYEVSLVNIKTLEASRYLTWEMTAMQISDYKKHSHNANGYLAGRISQIDSATGLALKDEVEALWGDDMNSLTSQNTSLARGGNVNGIFNEMASGMTVTKLKAPEEGMVKISDEMDSPLSKNVIADTPEETGSTDTVLDGFLENVLKFGGKAANETYKYFGFYVNGFPSASVSMKVNFSMTGPIYGGERLIEESMLPTLKSSQKMVIDSWDLKDGGDVDLGPEIPKPSSAGYDYYNQVNRMTFGGVFSSLGDLVGGGSFMDDILGILSKNIRLPWKPVVRSYALTGVKNKKDGCDGSMRNVKGCIKLEAGKSALKYGKSPPPQTFYTNAYKDTYTELSSNYFNVYQKQTPKGTRSKGYYMGCDRDQKVDRADCWND